MRYKQKERYVLAGKKLHFMPRENMDLNGLHCKGNRKHSNTEKFLLSLEELETSHISTTFLFDQASTYISPIIKIYSFNLFSISYTKCLYNIELNFVVLFYK